MANDNRSIRNKIGELRRDQQQAELLLRQQCMHRSMNGERKEIVKLAESRYRDPAILKDYPSSAVVCDGPDGCGAIFNAEMYSEADISAMAFQMNSVFEQIKLMAQLGKEEYDELMDAMDSWAIRVTPVLVFYRNMIKALKKKDDKQNNNRKQSKGGIGIPKNNFGRTA